MSLVAAAERETHSPAPEIIQPQEPVWPASLDRATQASLPLAAPPRRSAATSDVATSGIYLKHKEKVCPGMSVLNYHTHTKTLRALQRPPEDGAAQRQRPALGSQRPDNTELDGPALQGSLSKGKCCNYPKAWNASAAAASPADELQPGSRQAALPGPRAGFLSASMAAGFSQHRLKPGSQGGSELVARREARSWRASGSPLATPPCQPGCCRRARSLVCDWLFWKAAESHLRMFNVPQ